MEVVEAVPSLYLFGCRMKEASKNAREQTQTWNVNGPKIGTRCLEKKEFFLSFVRSLAHSLFLPLIWTLERERDREKNDSKEIVKRQRNKQSWKKSTMSKMRGDLLPSRTKPEEASFGIPVLPIDPCLTYRNEYVWVSQEVPLRLVCIIQCRRSFFLGLSLSLPHEKVHEILGAAVQLFGPSHDERRRLEYPSVPMYEYIHTSTYE